MRASHLNWALADNLGVFVITKGKLVGEVVDALSHIQNNMHMRSKLHLYDINTYCEEFAKELLNLVHGYKLINLNEEHMNAPGLDLGDKLNRISYQITSTKTSDKINETLSKITAQQLIDYDRYVVFILGEKQGSYTIKNPRNISFSDKTDIIDFNDIAISVLSLNLGTLEKVSSYVSREAPKILAEFEIKQKDELYTSSFYNGLEQIPTPKKNGFEGFLTFMQREGDFSDNEIIKINTSLENIVNALSKLPRLSREFLCIVFERSEFNTGFDDMGIPYTELFKFLSISTHDFDEELSYLNNKGLISFHDVETEFNIIRYISLHGGFQTEYISSEMKGFVETKNIIVKDLFVNLDFMSIS